MTESMSGERGISMAVRFCGAPTLDGGTCRQVVGLHSASGRCLFHDPERAAEAQEARQKGAGLTNSRPRPVQEIPPPGEPKTLADVIAWHSWVTVALASGQIEKATATGLSYNLQQLRAALVSRDLEREVEELRVALNALKRQRAGR